MITNLKINNSLRYYSKSLEIKRKIFGTDEHSSIAKTLSNIAHVYSNLVRHNEALNNYSKSLYVEKLQLS